MATAVFGRLRRAAPRQLSGYATPKGLKGDSRRRITNTSHQSPITDYRLPITDYRSPSSIRCKSFHSFYLLDLRFRVFDKASGHISKRKYEKLELL